MHGSRRRGKLAAGLLVAGACVVLFGCAGGRESFETVVMTASRFADLTPVREQFLALLGGENNRGDFGLQPTGYRDVVLNLVPSGNLNNNAFPGTFFAPSTGVIISTPGTGLRVSTNSLSDINPTYASQFSSGRILAPTGSNIIDLTFEVPGSPGSVAGVSSLGLGFSDVDTAGGTTVEFFDQGGRSLGTYAVPARTDFHETFLGVSFPGAVVTRARIKLGTGAIGAGVNDVSSGGATDVVAITEIIISEPLTVS